MKMPGYDPDKIVVALGTNQYGDGPEAVEEYYETLTGIYGTEKPILCISPIWRGDNIEALPVFCAFCEKCTDIMMHTMERYFTNGGNMESTDALAEGLLRTVKKNAVILRDDPQNYDARAEVMWAGSLAHNGLTGCGNDGGDWMTHKLEHELGGLYDVAHGAGLAAIWGTRCTCK